VRWSSCFTPSLKGWYHPLGRAWSRRIGAARALCPRAQLWVDLLGRKLGVVDGWELFCRQAHAHCTRVLATLVARGVLLAAGRSSWGSRRRKSR